MAKGKKVKKVTLSELQSYIQGAIEFNPKGWSPDKAQWDKIVTMIMQVIPDRVNAEMSQYASGGQSHPAYQKQDLPVMRQTSGLSLDGSTPVKEKIDLRKPMVEQIASPHGKDENGVVSSGKIFKGPARDDSNGLSPSEFE